MTTSRHPPANDRYPLVLLLVYAAAWLGLAIAPSYRQVWLLESLLSFAAVPLFVWTHRRLRLTDLACTLLFAFFLLHAVGAHYSYSEVPYDRWVEALTGHSVDLHGLRRNHYDRLVHLAYGLLVTPAAVEVLDARTPQRGVWRWIVPFALMLACSAGYEMLEWIAAEVFGGDLGQAYVGAQSDGWDAQKDMALAGLGAALTLVAYRALACNKHNAHSRTLQ